MKESEKRTFIRNLWFLMLYASDFFAYIEKQHGASKAQNPDRMADLIAEILTETVELRLRRNLNFAYEPRQEILRRVRGRIDLLKTVRKQLLQKAQIACRFEELTIDTPRNRFVRDALNKIASSVSKPHLANRCRSQALQLRQAGVNGIAPQRKDMEHLRYGRNDKNDKKMIFAAILAFDLSLPDESAGFNELFSPDHQGKPLHDLYEKAIVGFYKKTLGSTWQVLYQKEITWDITKHSARAKQFLPKMKLDIIMNERKGQRNIIIDTKFKKIFSQNKGWNGQEIQKLHSSNIYQIFTYLASQQGVVNSPVKDNAEGLLLYPCLGEELTNEVFQLQQFNVRFATVDFLQDERSIRDRLIRIIEDSPA